MNFGSERQSSHIRSSSQTTCRRNDCGAPDETGYWRANGVKRRRFQIIQKTIFHNLDF
jgi:hypothetical protein